MTEFEADDALASAAVLAVKDKRVQQVLVCTPDKDLSQCVSGTRIVQLDRRTGTIRDEQGVAQKFGVPPTSIPDYLALVGDASDGYPGLAGWGAKSSSCVLRKYPHLEQIPANYLDWHLNVATVSTLSSTLLREWDRALLFRDLATLRTDLLLFHSVDALRWSGPTPTFNAIARKLDAAKTGAHVKSASRPR
jgi:5'-3' exonuclease